MTRNRESNQLTLSGIAPSRALHGAVRQALYSPRAWLRAGVLAAGFAGAIPLAQSAPFPPVFSLASLYPAHGGDGSTGFVLTGVDSDESVGRSVGGAGDVNGDGIDDFIVGSPVNGAGVSYVVFGSTEGFPAVLPLASLARGDGSVGFVLPGIDMNDDSGRSASGAGDINGDGIDDLIVGAPTGSPPGGRASAGETYVVFGSTQGFPAVLPLASLFPPGGGDGSAGFVLIGIDEVDLSGWSVSAAGDVNGDGISDLLSGAVNADPGGRENAGETYVVFGSTQAFPAVLALGRLFPSGGGDGSAGLVLTGNVYDQSGYSVSAAGDVNGDGIDDLIVGAPGNGAGGAGVSYVVFGSTQGFPAVLPLATLAGGDGSVGFVLAGIDMYDYSGRSVSGAGDVNGDGIDDLIVGARFVTRGGRSGAGESYVVFGSSQGFPAVFPLGRLFPAGGGDGSAGFVLPGIETNDQSGSSVSGAGDVNGDGLDDLIVGAFFATPGGRSYAGESYVVFGSSQGFPAVLPLARLLPAGGGDGSAGFVLKGIDEGDNSGDSVSGAGDVNGDGIDDLIVGAPFADPSGLSNAGESYVVFGRSATQ